MNKLINIYSIKIKSKFLSTIFSRTISLIINVLNSNKYFFHRFRYSSKYLILYEFKYYTNISINETIFSKKDILFSDSKNTYIINEIVLLKLVIITNKQTIFPKNIQNLIKPNIPLIVLLKLVIITNKPYFLKIYKI